MDNILNSSGALIPKPDSRQFLYEASAGVPALLPEKYAIDDSLLPILNQKRQPSCVSHSAVDALKYYWWTETGKVVDFSPRFLHIMSGVQDNLGANDGRYPTTIFSILKNVGCCTEKTLPNDTTLSTNEYFDPNIITEEMLAEAAQYKIPAYKFVTLTEDSFRSALYEHGAVSVLFRIGRELWTDENGNVSYETSKINPLRAPANQASVVSGHQMTMVGWNNTDRGRNSWGIEWNDKGRFDFDFTKWYPYIVQAIVITKYKHTFWQTLTWGMTGNEVVALQEVLILEGFLKIPPNIKKGTFWTLTAGALKKFQVANGILDFANETDLKKIVCGKKTITLLNKKYSK